MGARGRTASVGRLGTTGAMYGMQQSASKGANGLRTAASGLVSSFPNGVWERTSAKLRFASDSTPEDTHLIARAERRGIVSASSGVGVAKRSFADWHSQTEFGNEVNEVTRARSGISLFPPAPSGRAAGSSRRGARRRAAPRPE